MEELQDGNLATLNKRYFKTSYAYAPIIGTPNSTKPPSGTNWVLKLLRVYFKLIAPLIPVKAGAQALDLFTKPRRRYTTQRYNSLLNQARNIQVQSNGFKIKGCVWENSGSSVLLAHGWETGGLHLGAFIEPLLKKGFRVVTFDGPAHGNSEGQNATLPDFAEAMLVMYREMGPFQHVIGHSFGGFASVYLASHYSTEIPLEKLVLISVPNKLTRVLEEFARTLELPDSVVASMDQHIKTIYRTDPRDIESGKMGGFMQVKNILVVHDRYDQVLPFNNGLEIVHDLPNAELLETQYLGHNRLLKHPKVISTIIDFLSRN